MSETDRRVHQHPILDDLREPDTYIWYNDARIPAVTGEPVAAALGAFLGADRIVYSLPSESGDKYISALPGAVPSDCVWNLSFD